MPNDRDTHFLGFARLLMQEVDERNRAKAQAEGHYLDEEELRLIIAQRAYDLAVHVLENTPNYIQYEIKDIPDLTQWPESPTDASS